ncbi:uncharacterized protein [Argopecten irradians]|uniref:uncharacterized protein n=1 Tax=Argopecten irradians TaxID=31199 RepID=UPI0037203D82
MGDTMIFIANKSPYMSTESNSILFTALRKILYKMNSYLVLALVINISILSRVMAAPVASECKNLSDEEEKQMLEEVYNTSNFTNTVVPRILTGDSVVSLKDLIDVQWNHPTHCPSADEIPNDMEAPVYHRSSCPWYFDIAFNADRFPYRIPRAVSRCKKPDSCVGITGDVEKNQFECGLVYMTIHVLRRVKCSETHSKWVDAYEDVAIGSACMKIKEAESENANSQSGPPLI